MLRLVFEKGIGNTYANQGNKNNHFGMPLALANIDKNPLNMGIF